MGKFFVDGEIYKNNLDEPVDDRTNEEINKARADAFDVIHDQGFRNDNGKDKEGTRNLELLEMAKEKEDFKERDIAERKMAIINAFIDYLRQNGLLNE